jgi:hypothetical protein
MKSSWEETIKRSKYHFDNFKLDKEVDKINYLGRFIGNFRDTVNEAVHNAKPATWRTRGYKAENVEIPETDIIAEENDLVNQGYDVDHVIANMSWQTNSQLEKIKDLFGLDNSMARVHVQLPGQTWNLHLDKLEKFSPDSPWRVVRLVIHLTDWEPGHFWNYGNFMHSQWRAGDVHSFDWQNLPHSTANAGHNPRVTYQLTGVLNEQSNEFINRLKRFNTYNLDL